MASDLVNIVLTLLCHGCPPQAIVAAFGLDERTVAAWQDRAGRHGQRLHAHLVQRGRVDLQHVQADALYDVTAFARVFRDPAHPVDEAGRGWCPHPGCSSAR